MMVPSDVARYAAEHASTAKLLENGKLQFIQTGMEFPPTTPKSVLEAYANGRAYKRALEHRANEGYDFAQHEPYIVPHKHRDEKHFLYCKLTDSILPRRKDTVIGHVNGKRFQRRLNKAEQQRAAAERIKEKRTKNRGKAREAGKKRHRGAEENAEMEGKDREENEMHDVHTGMLSDDDKDISEREDGDRPEDEEMNDVGVDKTEPHENMDEQEEEEDVFWTRGRLDAQHVDDDVENDDGDDEGNLAPRSVTRSMTNRNTKSRVKSSKKNTHSPNVRTEQDGKSDDELLRIKGETEPISGKRSRTEKIPKKLRRPRQRRKASKAGT